MEPMCLYGCTTCYLVEIEWNQCVYMVVPRAIWLKYDGTNVPKWLLPRAISAVSDEEIDSLLRAADRNKGG